MADLICMEIEIRDEQIPMFRGYFLEGWSLFD